MRSGAFGEPVEPRDVAAMDQINALLGDPETDNAMLKAHQRVDEYMTHVAHMRAAGARGLHAAAMKHGERAAQVVAKLSHDDLIVFVHCLGKNAYDIMVELVEVRGS